MTRLRAWIRMGWPPIVTVILFLLSWELAVRWMAIPEWVLPRPSRIWSEGVSGFPRIYQHTEATLRLTLIGFTVGVAAGILLALLMHGVPGMRSALYPLLILSQNIHPAALGPLLMIWFGFGVTPKIIVIGLVCFFPVVVALLDGLSQADPVMKTYMRMIGASRRDLMLKLELPGALPSLFSGLKIAATYSVMGAVIAEWLGADKGIGVYIQLSRNSFMTARVFVAIAVIVLVSLVLFGIVALAERLTIRWNRK